MIVPVNRSSCVFSWIGRGYTRTTSAEYIRQRSRYTEVFLDGGFDEEGALLTNPTSRIESRYKARDAVHEAVGRVAAVEPVLCANRIARPPISLKRIRQEPFKDRALFHITNSECFKQKAHVLGVLAACARDSSLHRYFAVAHGDRFSYHSLRQEATI